MSLFLHACLTWQAKRCLLSELLKNTFSVLFLVFPSPPLQVFHPGRNNTGSRERIWSSACTRDLSRSVSAHTFSCLYNSFPPSTENHGSWGQAALAVLRPAQGTALRVSVWVQREYRGGKVSLLRDGQGLVFTTPPDREPLPSYCAWMGSVCEAAANTGYAAITVLSCLVLHFRLMPFQAT